MCFSITGAAGANRLALLLFGARPIRVIFIAGAAGLIGLLFHAGVIGLLSHALSDDFQVLLKPERQCKMISSMKKNNNKNQAFPKINVRLSYKDASTHIVASANACLMIRNRRPL